MSSRMSHPPTHRKERDERGTMQYLVIWFSSAVGRATCLQRARTQGRIGGRPPVSENPKVLRALERLRHQGRSIRQIATELGISNGTVPKLVKAIVS